MVFVPLIRWFLAATGVALIALALKSDWLPLDQNARSQAMRYVILTGALLGTYGLTQLLNYRWECYRRRKGLVSIPKLLNQGVGLVLYLVTVIVVLQNVFHVSILGVLTAVGAVGVVVGLAIRELLSDIFAGFVLTMEHTFKIGDYVKIEDAHLNPRSVWLPA